MKFLDMVISEVLRLWPPAAATTRECNREYEMDLGNGKTFTAKVGDIFMLPISAIHHDERYFEDPLKFDPYRFSDERKDKIVAGSYIPFGYGPRVCIGSRFALMEAKLLVFSILSKFSIEVCDKTPQKLELQPSFSQLLFKNDVIVEYKLRKKDQ
jgi:cytochrome P450 family 9